MENLIFVLQLPVYVLSTYLVGRTFVQQIFSKREVIITNSLMMISGHIVITAVYAVFKTKGFTYLSIPLILLLGLYIRSIIRQGFELSVLRKERLNWKMIGLGLIFISIGFLSMYFRIFDFSGELKKIHTDFSFYGGVADFIGNYGVETLILDPLSISNTPYQPYHYFELWSASLFSTLLHSTGLKTLMLIVYPFHIFLVLLSIAELFRSSLNSILNLTILVLITLFISPFGQLLTEAFSAFLPIKIPFIVEHGVQTKMGMKLYAVQALFAIYFFYILRCKEWSFKFLIFLGVLMAIYPTIIPLGGTFLLMIWLVKLPKFASWLKDSFLIIPKYIWLLLIIFISWSIISVGLKDSAIAAYYPLKYILSFALVALAFIIPPSNSRVRWMIKLLLLLIILFALLINIGGTSFSIFHDPNFNQIITNFADPAFIILSIYVVLSLAYTKGSFVKLGAAFIVVFFYFAQGHQRAYTRSPMSGLSDEESLEILSSDPRALIAYQRDSADFEKTTIAWSIYYDIPYHNLRWFTDNYFPICLSLPDVNFDMNISDPSKKEWLSSIISRSSFYQYATITDSVLDKSVNEKVNLFIQAHNIRKVIHSDLR